MKLRENNLRVIHKNIMKFMRGGSGNGCGDNRFL